jgi:outer membrane protein assembly factor BamB
MSFTSTQTGASVAKTTTTKSESYRSWLQTSLISAAFTVVLATALVSQYLRLQANDPLRCAEIAALKERLLTQPKDEQLKEQIRDVDLLLRRRYFNQLRLNTTGGWLIFGGALAAIIAGKMASQCRQHLPMPRPNPGPREDVTTVRSRWSAAVVGGVIVLALSSVALTVNSSLPSNASALEKTRVAALPRPDMVGDFASAVEMQRNWPRFRGAEGSGTSTATNLPLNWSASSGSGILWKSDLPPLPGVNSPIVWGTRVFLSGGDAHRREVMCFDLGQGDLMWHQAVQLATGGAARPLELPEQTGYAASTMATDGRRVYAIFANGDLAALTFDGQIKWVKNLGVPKNPHGHATSLLTSGGKLIVQIDQGLSEQNASKLYAFDGATGELAWQRNRPVPASWATPLEVRSDGRAQIVALGAPWVIAYGVSDGAELWRVEGLNNEVTPSPVFASGLIYAVSPSEKLLAIRPGGQGNVTKTHVVWTAEDNIPDICSPVSDGELLFVLTTPGLLTCYDAKDGRKQWEQDLAIECEASPAIAAGRLYLFGTKGTSITVDLARQFKELARGELNEQVYASPAFVQDRILIRGVNHLFCIGAGSKVAKSN